ncbi:MAG: arylesterase [Candidatus Puniceispirillaceae bacterium]
MMSLINGLIRSGQRFFCLAMLIPALLTAVATASPALAETRLMVLGDSLVAGYGLAPGKSFPAQLERDLRAAGSDVTVLNAGVSGDTTAGGVARLDWSLADNPQAVIIVLGGNDMLRGLPPEAAAANLDAIITRLLARKVEVLLAGMLAPRNMGPAYTEAFDAIYPGLAARHDIEFYPFFLDGVALDPALNLDDGLHPNEAGIAEISRRILPAVNRLLARVEG